MQNRTYVKIGLYIGKNLLILVAAADNGNLKRKDLFLLKVHHSVKMQALTLMHTSL
jgi:hypothetical protein